MTPLTIKVSDKQAISATLKVPAEAQACYVLAHGAGAGMNHPFMAAVAAGLASRHIATLRYQLPYVENGSKRPDPPVELPDCAAKAAILNPAKGLSKTYAKHGVLVNAVSPAFIATPMTDAMMEKRSKERVEFFDEATTECNGGKTGLDHDGAFPAYERRVSWLA